MKKLITLVLLAAALAFISGCASEHSGTRDYVPGKGWVPND
jgi:hypothetical protein